MKGWLTAPYYTAEEAALLAHSINPDDISDAQDWDALLNSWAPGWQAKHLEQLRNRLCWAIKSAKRYWEKEEADKDGDKPCFDPFISSDHIQPEDLRKWFESKGEHPIFLFPNYAGEKTSYENIAPIPNELDASVNNRLQAMIDAATKYWKDKKAGDDNLPLNKVIAEDIEKQCGVSHSLADKMASIIRPDWAKDRTWKDNKKR